MKYTKKRHRIVMHLAILVVAILVFVGVMSNELGLVTNILFILDAEFSAG